MDIQRPESVKKAKKRKQITFGVAGVVAWTLAVRRRRAANEGPDDVAPVYRAELIPLDLRIERDATTSVEAYEAFSRGLLNMRAASRDSIDRAIADGVVTFAGVDYPGRHTNENMTWTEIRAVPRDALGRGLAIVGLGHGRSVPDVRRRR